MTTNTLITARMITAETAVRFSCRGQGQRPRVRDGPRAEDGDRRGGGKSRAGDDASSLILCGPDAARPAVRLPVVRASESRLRGETRWYIIGT